MGYSCWDGDEMEKQDRRTWAMLTFQWCSPRRCCLPRPIQVQAPKGNLHRYRGNRYRIIHLLWKESYPKRRKRPSHLSMPRRNNRL